MLERINQHDKNEEKEWFNEVIFFVSTDDFNKTFTSFLEHEYIERFSVSSWECKNKNKTSLPKMNEFDDIRIKIVLVEIDKFLQFLNLNYQNIIKSKQNNIFKCNECQAIYKNGKMIILKDSQFPIEKILKFDGNNWTNQDTPLRVKNLVLEFLGQEGRIERINDKAIFLKDTEINSPSMASNIALGVGASNGWDKWLDSVSNETLKKVYEE